MLSVKRILGHRSLLVALTGRELKARYRGSVLGFLWSLVNPLMLLMVYTFVFGVVFRPRVEGASPYAIFLVSGLFPWIWISSSLLEGTVSLSANAGLIRKSVFPVELLPLVPVLANLVNFLLSLPVIAIGILGARVLGEGAGGPGALLLPLVVALQLPALAGLSLALASLAVHFKDVRDIITNLLTLLFFLSPILYSLDSIPGEALRLLIRLNPVSPFVVAYQKALFWGTVPPAWTWLGMGISCP